MTMMHLAVVCLLSVLVRAQLDNESAEWYEDREIFSMELFKRDLVAACPELKSRDLPTDVRLKHNKTVNVSLDLSLMRIMEVNDLEKTMTILANFMFKWGHPYCTYDVACPAQTNLFSQERCSNTRSRLIMTTTFPITGDDRVWYPSLLLQTAADKAFPVDSFRNELAVSSALDPFPSSVWAAIGIFKTNCDSFSFTKFPFDSVACTIVFQSFEFTEVLQFDITGFQSAYGKDVISETDIWKFDSLNYSQTTRSFLGVLSYTELQFTISLTRNSIYYVPSIFMPTFATFFVQLTTLWLQPDSYDRPAFSMVVVLANSVTLSLILGMIPRTAEIIYVIVVVAIKYTIGIVLTIYMLFTCTIGTRPLFVEKYWCSLTVIRFFDVVIGLSLAVFTLIADIIIFMKMTSD